MANKKELNKIRNVAAVGGPSPIAEKLNDYHLLDQKIELMSDKIHDSGTEDNKTIREIHEGKFPKNVVKEQPELEKMEIPVQYNVDGKVQLVADAPAINKSKDIKPEDISDVDDLGYDEEAMKKTMSDMGFKEEDMLKVYELVKKYQANKEMNVYKEMPAGMQQMVKIIAPNAKDKAEVNHIAKEVLEQLINEFAKDKVFADFDTALKDAANIPDLSDLYSDYLKEQMDKLEDLADKVKDKNPEQAKLYRSMSNAFKCTYTYERHFDLLMEDPSLKRKLKKDAKRFKNILTDIDYKYHDTVQTIKSIRLTLPILDRFLDKEKYTEEDIKELICLHYELIKNMSPRKISDHILMYYFIFNILSLQYTNLSESKFNIQLLGNLERLLDKIKEL